MRDIDYRGLKVTYGQLAAALMALGFAESRGKTELDIPYRAFDNKEYNTWTLLPDLPDNHLVESVHIRSAERAVEDWGVADSETFFRLLREATQKEVQVA
jgi:hypothetical protein